MGFATEPPDNETLRETRDLLKELNSEIKKSNSISNNLNLSMIFLTGIIAILTIIEFITRIVPWILSLC